LFTPCHSRFRATVSQANSVTSQHHSITATEREHEIDVIASPRVPADAKLRWVSSARQALDGSFHTGCLTWLSASGRQRLHSAVRSALGCLVHLPGRSTSHSSYSATYQCGRLAAAEGFGRLAVAGRFSMAKSRWLADGWLAPWLGSNPVQMVLAHINLDHDPYFLLFFNTRNLYGPLCLTTLYGWLRPIDTGLV
jgi:hypothetical protein